MDVIIKTNQSELDKSINAFILNTLAPISPGISLLTPDTVAGVDGTWELQLIEHSQRISRWRLTTIDDYDAKILLNLIAWESLDFT